MYKSFEPAPALSPFVECYWSWQINPGDGALEDILPDAAPELIVHFAATPLMRDELGKWQQQHRDFIYCAAHRALRLSIQEAISLFAIRFRPWGVSRFSHESMANMLDRSVHPSELLHQLGDKLVTAIRAVSSDACRVEVANRMLEQALQLPSRNETRFGLLLEAVNGGRCSSAEMARILAMSNRSFSRLWSELVGIQPRKFIQLMRFHNALSMINEGNELATVAAECGYSDQPHMARQIKAIAGLPASSLRRQLGNKVYRDLYTARPGAPWHARERT
jgi:AraC-like DNA-binding protein